MLIGLPQLKPAHDVPGATKTRSPSTAAFTAAWMVEYCDGTSRSAAEASEAWTNTNRHDTIAGVFMAFSFWVFPEAA
jgi:hypothetical protein